MALISLPADRIFTLEFFLKKKKGTKCYLFIYLFIKFLPLVVLEL